MHFFVVVVVLLLLLLLFSSQIVAENGYYGIETLYHTSFFLTLPFLSCWSFFLSGAGHSVMCGIG